MTASAAPPDRRLSEFDFALPPELIAQTPLLERDRSRLLVVDRLTGALDHSTIRDLPCLLAPGDLLVANNSRVLPARLIARKATSGGRVELLLLRENEDGSWLALAKPVRRLQPGTRLAVAPRRAVEAGDAEVRILGVGDAGEVRLAFAGDAASRLTDYGTAPLPPYIRRPLADEERYQTIYGSAPGSAAAPTAGLHFTEALLRELRERGIGWAEVTLHVGVDTFRPVTVDRVSEHRIHREWCAVPDETAQAVAAARARGSRVVAVGTTAARTLETLAQHWDAAAPRGWSGWADLFIAPGYRWRLVDAMLTNFHLPRSTLLLMVSAFASQNSIRRAYEEATEHRYRFYSFGDAMLMR